MSSQQRMEVWRGTRLQTSGGLRKSDLIKNKRGKIVSKKKSRQAGSQNNLGSWLRKKGVKVSKEEMLRSKTKPPAKKGAEPKSSPKPKAADPSSPKPKPKAPKAKPKQKLARTQVQSGQRKQSKAAAAKPKINPLADGRERALRLRARGQGIGRQHQEATTAPAQKGELRVLAFL